MFKTSRTFEIFTPTSGFAESTLKPSGPRRTRWTVDSDIFLWFDSPPVRVLKFRCVGCSVRAHAVTRKRRVGGFAVRAHGARRGDEAREQTVRRVVKERRERVAGGGNISDFSVCTTGDSVFEIIEVLDNFKGADEPVPAIVSADGTGRDEKPK